MARKPTPRHAKSTRPQRDVAHWGQAPDSPQAPPAIRGPAKPAAIRPSTVAHGGNAGDAVRLSSFASIAVAVAGATVMAGGAHGYGDVVTIPPQVDTQVAGTQQVAAPARLGAADTASVTPNPLPVPALGPASSLQEEAKGRPASVWINSISAGSDLLELGLNDAGALEVPIDFGVAGWWKGGPRPGDPGPAVITGHLDSTKGPGVFAKLGRVKPGDEVVVRRNDGVKLTFVVTRIDRYPKRAFPTRTVYGPTDAPELRVITCGGDFDRSAASYVSNIVVFAKLASPTTNTNTNTNTNTRA